MSTRPPIYGLMAEFASPQALVDAARAAREAGYTVMDGFSPFPIEELSEALGVRRTRLPLVVLIAGLLGGLGGYFLQYYSAVHDYPLNIGNRPVHSWPAFIPVTFELTILCAALGAVLGMLGLNGLPMPYHPVFNVPNFTLASRDRFFLAIEATDPIFDTQETNAFLRGLHPLEVSEIEH